MNPRWYFGIFWFIFALPFIVGLGGAVITYRKNRLRKALRADLQRQHPEATLFLCTSFDRPQNGSVQLHGETWGGDIRRGDTLRDSYGARFEVTETYGSVTVPDEQSDSIPDGMRDGAFVATCPAFDAARYRAAFRRQGGVALIAERRRVI